MQTVLSCLEMVYYHFNQDNINPKSIHNQENHYGKIDFDLLFVQIYNIFMFLYSIDSS